MPATSIGWIHFVLAIAAIAAGGAVALLRKATRTHVWLGRVYAGLMVGLNVTALMLSTCSGTSGRSTSRRSPAW